MHFVKFGFVVGLTVCLVNQAGAAIDPAALQMIRETAHDICGKTEAAGSQSRIALRGDANASVARLIRRLVDVGASVKAEYERDGYVGLPQNELAQTFNNERECRERIFQQLIERIIPTPAPPATGQGKPIAPVTKAKKPADKSTVSTAATPSDGNARSADWASPSQSATEFAVAWLDLLELNKPQAYSLLARDLREAVTHDQFFSLLAQTYEKNGAPEARSPIGADPLPQASRSDRKYTLVAFKTKWKKTVNSWGSPGDEVVITGLSPTGTWEVAAYRCLAC
ncbi:hypothetical protein [Acidovorax sp. LjRoot117]|uniref:hypothetical protein n=1 Tax=Acidovorax sp. LjRoot117 TaxID=3342255 RepID=UPI003ECC7426